MRVERTGYQQLSRAVLAGARSFANGCAVRGAFACEAYTRFALDAGDMSRSERMAAYRSFGEWASDGQWTEAAWNDHLTTLFPEVRPRGHLEVRSIDALEPAMLGAPLILLAGLIYDEPTCR